MNIMREFMKRFSSSSIMVAGVFQRLTAFP